MTNGLTYQIVAELLHALEQENYVLGIGKHLQIQSLLQKLPDEIDDEGLKGALIPLLAQSPAEQERLYGLFDDCVKRVNERQPLIDNDDPSVNPQKGSGNLEGFPNLSPLYLLLFTLFVLIIGIGTPTYFYYQQTKEKPRVEIKEPQTTINPNDTLKTVKIPPPTEGVNYFVENKPYPFPNHLNDYQIHISPTEQWLSNNWKWLRILLFVLFAALLMAVW